MNKEELHAAYLDTNYVVIDGDERIVIRIGERNGELDGLLKEHGVSEWVFITAYNPYSQELAFEENEKRQRELCLRLENEGFAFLRGFGEAANGEWTPEPSLLVFGLGRDAATALAKELEQNAIVCGRLGEGAELFWAA